MKQNSLQYILSRGFIFFIAALFCFSPSLSHALTGSYRGVVHITSPLVLGELDLALDLWDEQGNVHGDININQTIIFPAYQQKNSSGETVSTGPSMNGSVNSSQQFFTLTSEDFKQEVAGRTVTRKITLSNGQISEEGNKIKGNYTEVIKNFIPQDIIVRGTFELVRPNPLGYCTDRDGDKILTIHELADGGGKDMYTVELNELLVALRLFYNGIDKGEPIDLNTMLKALRYFYENL